ncbi:hypothetical protein U9527_21155 [Escherichia coli]
MNELFSQGGKGSTGILTNKQAIARKFGVKHNEVVYFAVGVDLGGYKVIYDKSTQRAYSLPALPVGTTAVSLNVHAVLVHSAGTVDLGELAATRREFVNLSDSFATGLIVNTRNELLFHNGIGYTYLGTLPVTITAGINPVGNPDWKPQTDPNFGRDEVNDDIRAYVRDGDPIAPDYTQALKRAIASGRGRVYINVPVEIKEDLTIPRLFRVDVDKNGYIYSTTNKVRIEGFINSIGGGDPYRNYIKQYGVNSSTVPGVYMANVVVNIPEDFPTMQAAIDAVPDNYWQFITLQISDGIYDEDLVIRNKKGCCPTFPPASGQQAILVITSKSKDRSKVSFRSAQVFSCGGTPFSPNLENLNFTNRTHSDEDCSVEFYGCTSGAVNKCSFNGVGVDKCIEAYNSIIIVEACHFGDNINDKGMVVKHGGTILSASTQIGGILQPITGTLKSWVAVGIGGTIIANDLSSCIGKVAQSRVDGVQSGVIVETVSKSINGVTNFFRLATTRHHTQFQDYDKFTNTVTGSGSSLNYYPEGGLVVNAGTAGGTALLRYKRERRLVRQHETSNYLGFAVACTVPSGVTALNCHLVCGSVESGNYFGIRYINNVAHGVICRGGVETTTPLAYSTETICTWTCKYLGKGDGQVLFMYDDVYAGHINGIKLASYDGTYFEANVTNARTQLYELEFVSSM